MQNPSNKMLPIKILFLWTVFLLGTLFHTQLALMPLFHGASVAESHLHEAISMSTIMWFMLIFFSLPLLAIIGCMLTPSRWFRSLHFGMTLVYTGLNLMHLILDAVIAVPGYQLTLMGLLFLVGLILNGLGYQWMKVARATVRLSPSG